MYSFSIQHSPPAHFITQLAKSQNVVLSDNAIRLSPGLAKGYLKAYKLSAGCGCLVSDYNLKDDFHLHKFSLLKEFFILRIDEVTHAANSVVMAGRKFNSDLSPKKYSLVFLSSLVDFDFIAPKDSHVKSIEIFIPRQWLYKKLVMRRGDKKLSTYLEFKNRKSLVNFINPSFIKLVKDIMIKSRQDDGTAFKKETKSLLEKFISNLGLRLKEVENGRKIKIVDDEVQRLLGVKDYLVKDLSLLPAFSNLQYIAAMSGTALKTKFKKMYGVTMYEYFQQMRMEKAGILLRSHKYSVGEVGHQMGYSKLSNFSIAFRKEFGQLPREYVQIHKDLSQPHVNNKSYSSLN